MTTYKIPKKGMHFKEERIEFWAKVIADQDKSGLCATDFCRKHDISTGLFYQWRFKLSHSDEEHHDDSINNSQYKIPSNENSTIDERRKLWAKAIADQQRSGFNASDFCKKHGLDRKQFYQYAYRFRQALLSRVDKEDHNDNQDKPVFVPVTVSEDSAQGEVEITIKFPNGNTISLTTKNITSVLNELIKQIGAN